MNKLPSRNPHPHQWYGCLLVQIFIPPLLFGFSSLLSVILAILGLILFFIASEWSDKQVYKLNELANCLDSPVTDWPPMSLDHFKWMLWNCELRGREITSKEVADYCEYVLGRISIKDSIKWGDFHGEIMERESVALVMDVPYGVSMMNYLRAFGMTAQEAAWTLAPKSDYELIEEGRTVPARPLSTPRVRPDYRPRLKTRPAPPPPRRFIR